MPEFFITKYALKDGKPQVFSQDLTIPPSGRVMLKIGDYPSFFTVGIDAFTDRGSAMAAIDKMRKRKIQSLKKQIAKLEAMKVK